MERYVLLLGWLLLLCTLDCILTIHQVPVIVAENKVDLYRPSSTAGMSDDQALARKRQQIVSLMQRFPFVRQCIKCSAKNLLRVDDIFVKAQQAVLYPFTPPLYDLETGQLTIECQRALTRIFRIYDRDFDGLLSDMELDRFQRETYHVAIFDRDLSAWKKVVTRHNPTDQEVLVDGKFTIAGFLAIFDVFISQNRLDVVWQCLRKFGYDDDLNLHVPESVATPTDIVVAVDSIHHTTTSWKLSSAAKKFLSATFQQYDSNRDGVLSTEDIMAIFSILPPPSLPPWHPLRVDVLFQDCFSVPMDVSSTASLGSDSPSTTTTTSATPSHRHPTPSLLMPLSESLSNSGISILSAGDSLPSVNVLGQHNPRPMSFLEWTGMWHGVSAISPSIARSELFRLGHVEDSKHKRHESKQRRWKKTIVPTDGLYEASLRSREIRVLVLGSHGSGKTALLQWLRSGESCDTIHTLRPQTSTTFVKLKRKPVLPTGRADEDGEEFVVHLVFTDVPESAAASQEEHLRGLTELFGSTPKDRICDLAMLVFDCTKASSFLYAKELESSLLTKETPRVYVGTKADLIRPPEPEDGDVHPATVLDNATIHCRESELESPLVISVTKPSASAVETNKQALSYLARCALSEPGVEPLRSRPHEEQKRREAARRKFWMGIGGIVTVGVVLVGVGWWLGGGRGSKKEKTSGLSWIRTLFGYAGASEEAPQES